MSPRLERFALGGLAVVVILGIATFCLTAGGSPGPETRPFSVEETP